MLFLLLKWGKARSWKVRSVVELGGWRGGAGVRRVEGRLEGEREEVVSWKVGEEEAGRLGDGWRWATARGMEGR